MKCIWKATSKPVVEFESIKEALEFVVEWRFGTSNLYVYQKWGLPRPCSSPEHTDLDEAIEKALCDLVWTSRKDLKKNNQNI